MSQGENMCVFMDTLEALNNVFVYMFHELIFVFSYAAVFILACGH